MISRTVQEFLDHRHVKTTMVYIHLQNHGLSSARSPANRAESRDSWVGEITRREGLCSEPFLQSLLH